MRIHRTQVSREFTGGASESLGAFYLGDVTALCDGLIERYGAQAQAIYIDPPFMTGKRFQMKMRVGERDWNAQPSLTLTAYEDTMSEAAFLTMMETAVRTAHALLKDNGVLFVHIDYRMSAKLRLLMDEIFGANNLLNEIIWAYQTGGRAERYFSRKHDTILFYRKSRAYYFNIKAVPIKREGVRRNHMKRHLDTDGRAYRSIRSGGKVYTYYEDAPCYPGDVWDDVSHLQQKDPQRTGYDTQKPLRLLERIVGCSTRENDLVMDLFAGSGTTLAACAKLGRRFVGVDQSKTALYAIRRRMEDVPMEIIASGDAGEPVVRAFGIIGIGNYEIELSKFEIEPGLLPRLFTGFDALDNWAVGYIEDGVFTAYNQTGRTRAEPAIATYLRLPIMEKGQPAIRVGDILGRNLYYAIDKDGMDT